MFYRFTLRQALAAVTVSIPTGYGTPLADCCKDNSNSSSSKGNISTTTAVIGVTDAFSLIADYSGSGFFNHFTTFTGPDPTLGTVNFVDMQTARAKKFLRFKPTNDSLHAIIGADYTNIAPSGRDSIRLVSKQVFSPGTLSVLDVRHIPVQWGMWPAIWFLGDVPNGAWPASNGGEADWLEWVHETPYNSMTLHTGPGCIVRSATNSVTSTQYTGTLQNPDCNSNSGYEGCSITAPQATTSINTSLPTAGHAFNAAGGAVYVHLWDASGVTVWMFPHDALPADLATGTAPNPASWAADPKLPPPLARFDGPGCDFTAALRDLRLIINIDFCGTWAGAPDVWAASGAATATGVGSCAEYVANNPQAFEEAYFEVAALRFYQNSIAPGVAA